MSSKSPVSFIFLLCVYKDMESTNTKNLRHLYDLTHAVPEIPELGAAYTFKLVKTFNTKGLIIPQAAQGTRYCSHCSTVFVPGVNMSMRIVFSKVKRSKKGAKTKAKTWTPRKRTLRYTCFCCDKTTDYDILNPTAPRDAKKDRFELPREPFVAKWDPKKNDNMVKTKDTGNKAKERAKKRKKNSLSSLLSGKKDAEEKEKKKSSLLSLNEFMKM